jgi:hypothetical protein
VYVTFRTLGAPVSRSPGVERGARRRRSVAVVRRASPRPTARRGTRRADRPSDGQSSVRSTSTTTPPSRPRHHQRAVAGIGNRRGSRASW